MTSPSERLFDAEQSTLPRLLVSIGEHYAKTVESLDGAVAPQDMLAHLAVIGPLLSLN